MSRQTYTFNHLRCFKIHSFSFSEFLSYRKVSRKSATAENEKKDEENTLRSLWCLLEKTRNFSVCAFELEWVFFQFFNIFNFHLVFFSFWYIEFMSIIVYYRQNVFIFQHTNFPPHLFTFFPPLAFPFHSLSLNQQLHPHIWCVLCVWWCRTCKAYIGVCNSGSTFTFKVVSWLYILYAVAACDTHKIIWQMSCRKIRGGVAIHKNNNKRVRAHRHTGSYITEIARESAPSK